MHVLQQMTGSLKLNVSRYSCCDFWAHHKEDKIQWVILRPSTISKLFVLGIGGPGVWKSQIILIS